MTATAVVKFARIGRNHEPPSVAVESEDPDVIAQAVYRHARHYLVSRDVEVVVDLDTADVTIYAGFQVGGTGHLTFVDAVS